LQLVLDILFADGTVIHEDELSVIITTPKPVSNIFLSSPPIVASLSLSGDLLTVSSPSSESIALYSLSGSLLLQASKEKGSTSIDIGHLPRGVLIVRGSSGWSRKVFRQ
jgi:hypothetical protein